MLIFLHSRHFRWMQRYNWKVRRYHHTYFNRWLDRRSFFTSSKNFHEVTEWIGKWRLKISAPKTEVVSCSSICKVNRESAKDKVLQRSTMNFATRSTVLGITIDNKMNFRAQFEKCTRKYIYVCVYKNFYVLGARATDDDKEYVSTFKSFAENGNRNEMWRLPNVSL